MSAALLDRPAEPAWEMTEAERELWSRRRLLGTMLGGAVALCLGACGDDGDGAVAANSDGTTTTGPPGRPTRVAALVKVPTPTP